MPRRAIGRLLAAKPRSDFHLILRNTSLAMAGFLFRPLSRVPFLFIVARLYGEAAFGRYVFAVGVFEALAAAARLGLRDTLFRFMAEDGQEPNGVLVDCLVVGAGLAALVALVVTLGSPVFGRLGASELWPSLRALAPLLPFYVLTDILLAATRAQWPHAPSWSRRC
jgi:O-antigen/teichoic acid export membrane protein